MSEPTPMMKQYWAFKKEYPDCILFFRMGDFYEMFGDDAVVAAKALNIALTTRDKGSKNPIPMCGVPFHAIDGYLPRMIRAGFKVAICEQVEDPKLAKGLVKRDVTRVVTPGVVLESAMLDEGAHNFLAAVAPAKDGGCGLAEADLSTGLFRACQFDGPNAVRELMEELSRIDPKQILVPETVDAHKALYQALMTDYPKIVDRLEPWLFGHTTAEEKLLAHFGVASLDGYGLEGKELAVSAAGAAIHYLLDTQKGALAQMRRLSLHNPSEAMLIDPATLRNLELTRNLIDGGRKGSLLDIMDRTVTPMGARLLREWLVRPLVDVDKIERRLATVAAFRDDPDRADDVRGPLTGIGDLERIAVRVTNRNCSPRDLIHLANGLSRLPQLRTALERIDAPVAAEWKKVWDDMADVADLLAVAIADDPPAHARDGGAVRSGYDPTLDELRAIKADARKAILAMEEAERKSSGIAALKVKFNRVYGYFIEVSKRQSDQVPAGWIRKQSLVNAERYVSPALKELEEKIVNAEEKATELELSLYERVRERAAREAHRAQFMAGVVAAVDLFAGLAAVAGERHYVRPTVDADGVIDIRDGRHPVIEAADLAERFVPNDALLDRDSRRLSIITGPNMAGKSTFIRQVALIALMAQAGSFVPAAAARIGVADRIFTRVGAQDHLQRGQSTFMVEMNETANILNNASAKSLVILDEIGRGTSTFDGISIAWAVAEYLAAVGCRALFASHYHELTELADSLPGVANLSVAVKEWNDEIIFLRKIVDGGADRSYGIQVARLAGLPKEVIERAGEILTDLETNEFDAAGHPKLKAKAGDVPAHYQISMFAPPTSEVEEELRRLDVDGMTPLGALNALAGLKKRLIK
jgi:DNA mismatch repair protein MutS